MDGQETVHAAADTARAWAGLSAVTQFPRWTASMRSVEPLDGEDLAVGRRYRIRQPGLMSAVWRVTEVRPGEAFTWETSAPGVRTTAFHTLAADADGGTQISIGLHQEGPLVGLVDLFYASRARRYLKLEASGLKAAAEHAD